MILAILNGKGGCGKSTTARNTIYEFSQIGKRVLAIDLDIGCALTTWLDTDNQNQSNIGLLLTQQISIDDAVISTRYPDVDLICGSPYLLSDIELLKEINMVSGSTPIYEQLYWVLNQIKENYDAIIIDGNPNIDILMSNAIYASDYIVIPTKPSVDNIDMMFRTIDEIESMKSMTHITVKYGVLITMKDRIKIANDTVPELKEVLGDKLLNTVIRYQASPVSNSEAESLAIRERDKRANVGLDYQTFSEELRTLLW